MEPQQPNQAPDTQNYQPATGDQSVAPQSPQPVQAVGATDPGKGLGIASLVTALLGMGLIGLILGFVAKSKSKKAGYSNGLATAGIIISAISLVITTIIFVIAVVAGFNVAQKCSELGPGVHYDNGTKITCS